MKRAELELVLHRLRCGDATFQATTQALGPVMRRKARAVMRRYAWTRQSLLGPDDIEQEMWVALWRAVDEWDVATYPSIATFAEKKMFSAATHALGRASGHPDPRRDAVAIPETVDDITAVAGTDPGDPEQIVAAALVCARFRALLKPRDRAAFDAILNGDTTLPNPKGLRPRAHRVYTAAVMNNVREAFGVAMEN